MRQLGQRKQACMQLPSYASAVSPTTCHLCLPPAHAQIADAQPFYLFEMPQARAPTQLYKRLLDASSFNIRAGCPAVEIFCAPPYPLLPT